MKSARIALLLGTALIASSSFAFAQEKGGVINVATVGEPPTLDPMASTADLVGIVSQHMFETLYTFDKDWKPTPLLAAALPEISADGKTYTIKLRSGVKFHDGTDMDATDVVASLERWTKTASRGKQTATTIAGIEAVDPTTVKISLNTPYAPLVSLLAFNNSAAIVLPSEKQAEPMVDFVGTGPYKLKERKADQYIQLDALRRLRRRPRAKATVMAARATSMPTKSASCRFPTRTPASRPPSPASTTTSIHCRSNPSNG